jgi:hypothetical protein
LDRDYVGELDTPMEMYRAIEIKEPKRRNVSAPKSQLLKNEASNFIQKVIVLR